jgi:hypothetical protein
MRTSAQILNGSALTASGATSAFGISNDNARVTAFVAVSAVSGTTPSATFTLQDSPDGTNWFDLDVSSAVTAAGNLSLAIPVQKDAPFVRVSYAITGTTPSFTTSVWVEARG